MRIDKFLSECGRLTRSEAAKAARRGEIAVNGKIITKSDVHIDPERDELTLRGERIVYRRFVYIMLNKPSGYVSATEAPGDRCVTELLGDEYSKLGLFPCGRLDRDTVGLMLLTNDGELAHLLLSPKRHVDKIYRFGCADPLTEADVSRLEDGIELADGYKTKKSRLKVGDDRQSGEITLTEGKYHQIKRMFGALGNKITSLERISFGSLTLDRALGRGEYRELTESEVSKLRSLTAFRRI